MILQLRRETWWAEVGNFGLPPALVDMIRGLVNAELHDQEHVGLPLITPEATPALIAFVAERLDGIKIDDEFYAIVVQEPRVPDESRVSRFLLIRSLPELRVRQVERTLTERDKLRVLLDMEIGAMDDGQLAAMLKIALAVNFDSDFAEYLAEQAVKSVGGSDEDQS